MGDLDSQIATVRSFNRAYTQIIGVLEEGLLKSPFTLAQARVLYELAHHEGRSAGELARWLGLDPAYLSRILKEFEARGMLLRSPVEHDGRQSLLSLTDAGRAAFAPLDALSRAEVGALLACLSDAQRQRLIACMTEVRSLLGAGEKTAEPFVLREPRPGDMGWIVHRHGLIYAEEFGWDETFEAMVAEIVARFIRELKPQRERCWVAEREGAIVGSLFLVEESAEVAKLRLLYVEPRARGLGIGRRLVEESLHFARAAGYARVTLWTNDVLVAARRLYEGFGFRLVDEKRHFSFGRALVGQTWALKLRGVPKRPPSLTA